MGGAIAGMHYTGMAAYQVAGHLVWNPALVVVSVALARALASVSSRARGFSGFFRAIDGDGDGELTTRELRRYFDGVGGRDLDERREVARAARATVETMDTEDEGTTVNLRELRRAARGMANARDVGEWVGRGVGYPEYAEAFVESRITLLDFPQLLARDGDGLRRMGVYRDSFYWWGGSRARRDGRARGNWRGTARRSCA